MCLLEACPLTSLVNATQTQKPAFKAVNLSIYTQLGVHDHFNKTLILHLSLVSPMRYECLHVSSS